LACASLSRFAAFTSRALSRDFTLFPVFRGDDVDAIARRLRLAASGVAAFASNTRVDGRRVLTDPPIALAVAARRRAVASPSCAAPSRFPARFVVETTRVRYR
jgi:hypothetical protein